MAPGMAVLAAVIAPAMAGPAAATDRAAEVARLAAETWVRLLALAGYWL
jgi:hypothetical protein